VRIGVSRWVRPTFELFGGAGFETAATPDATLVLDLADADNMEIALGARLQLSKHFYFAASYTHLQFLDRDNTGKSTLASAPVPTQQQDGGGQYTRNTQWVGIFDLNLEMTF
jgi:long-subunit fatty acid transport protein